MREDGDGSFEWYGRPALLSILVASDNEKSVTRFTSLLVAEGHAVHSVYRSDLVAPAVDRHRPDVCFLHLDTPGESAYAVAQELRRLPPSRRPFLIALPGASRGANDELLARNAGFDGLLANATDPAALLQFIREVGIRCRARKS